MKQVHGMIGIIMMLLLSMMMPQVQLGKTAHAATTYTNDKAGYEQWLSDNASRKVSCPADNLKDKDKLGMFYCQCVSFSVFRLLQSGISEDFIRNLGLGSAGTWADNANVAPFIIRNDAITQKWATSINNWFGKDVVTSYKFISFGNNAPLVLEVKYRNGGGHVMIVDSVTNPVMNVTDYNGSNTGDYHAFQLVRLTITSPSVNAMVRGFWKVTWIGNGAKHFQMRDSFGNFLVNEPVSGNSYQAKNEAWARIQRGTYCAHVGESSNGPWSDSVCFNVDNTISIGGGLYRISSAGTNLSLDVKDRKDEDGKIIQIWAFTGSGGSNQKWRFASRGDGFYAIRTEMSSKRCLDVKGNSQDNGRNLQIWKCHFDANQQFRVVDMGSGRYVIVARHSGKVLDVKGGVREIKNGTTVQQYDVHGQGNQLWEIVQVR